MKILSIDPGTATTGFGVIECRDNQLFALDYGWIKTPKEDSDQKRLARIHREATSLITRHHPDVMAIERLFFFINAKTAMAVAESIGVIKLAAENQGVAISTHAPLEIKNTVTGSGKAKKKDVQLWVRKTLKVSAGKKKKTHFDDLADALAVGICYAKKSQLFTGKE